MVALVPLSLSKLLLIHGPRAGDLKTRADLGGEGDLQRLSKLSDTKIETPSNDVSITNSGSTVRCFIVGEWESKTTLVSRYCFQCP